MPSSFPVSERSCLVYSFLILPHRIRPAHATRHRTRLCTRRDERLARRGMRQCGTIRRRTRRSLAMSDVPVRRQMERHADNKTGGVASVHLGTDVPLEPCHPRTRFRQAEDGALQHCLLRPHGLHRHLFLVRPVHRSLCGTAHQRRLPVANRQNHRRQLSQTDMGTGQRVEEKTINNRNTRFI